MSPVTVLSMVPPERLRMPLLPPEFDIVMVPELEMVPSLLMPTPPEFDIVMVPVVLSRVLPDWLLMPLLPVFDIVMMPALLIMPPSLKIPSSLPVFDIVMVPAAVLSRKPPLLSMPMPAPVFDTVMSPELLMEPPELLMPVPPEFDIVMVPELVTVLQTFGQIHSTGVMTYCQWVQMISSLTEQ